MTSRSPPGSTTAARPVASQTSSELFCWNGVTGIKVTFMDDGAAGKTLIVPASCRGSPRAPRSPRGGFCLLIFAASVKIHQGFQSLASQKFSFGYNGRYVQGIVHATQRCVPIKNGREIAIQVWAVAVVDGRQVSMHSMHTSCPARRRAPATDLTSVTLGGAYAAVPVR